MDDWQRLVVSVCLDVFGYFSYSIPVVGEITDILFSLLQAAWIKYAYKTNVGAVLGGLEELLPFTDFIPACTIVHFLTRKKRLEKY